MVVPYQAVLLIAFGGPTSPAEIRPFLARITQGIPLPAQRLEDVAHHYEAVGGKSPLNEITARQAHALQELLREQGMDLPVYIGMRNAAPFLVDTLRRMAGDGIERALGLILSSHRTEASWERYQKNVADARLEIGADAPKIDYCAGWHDHPLFIQSWAELLQASFAGIPRKQRPTTPLVFTAHSVPIPMANRSPYVEQLETTARLVAQKIGHENWSIAYQSRSGKPTDPWLEPDVNAIIRDLAAQSVKDVIVAPIGFVCDHVEVLYDLDIEAKKTAQDLKVNLIRANCPNDHATFIQMIADVIITKIAKSIEAT
ncbi:MAG: ferrochelatase [Candidatus Binatia bacterium]